MMSRIEFRVNMSNMQGKIYNHSKLKGMKHLKKMCFPKF